MSMRDARILLVGLGLALTGGCDDHSTRTQSSVGSVQPSAGPADAGAGAGGSAGAAGRREGPAGGSSASTGTAQCPAPLGGQTSSMPTRWARDPETATCCPYARAAEAPKSWPSFETEAECESECRCATLEDFDEAFGLYDTERTSLACRCNSGDCPATIEEASAALCATGQRVRRLEGCGLVRLIMSTGYTSDSWVFEPAAPGGDASSPAAVLVGATSSTDAQSDPCQTFRWVAGREFDCDDAVECMVCDLDPDVAFGAAMPEAPPGCN
jgi:hypothetical protein